MYIKENVCCYEAFFNKTRLKIFSKKFLKELDTFIVPNSLRIYASLNKSLYLYAKLKNLLVSRTQSIRIPVLFHIVSYIVPNNIKGTFANLMLTI